MLEGLGLPATRRAILGKALLCWFAQLQNEASWVKSSLRSFITLKLCEYMCQEDTDFAQVYTNKQAI